MGERENRTVSVCMGERVWKRGNVVERKNEREVENEEKEYVRERGCG